MEDRVRGIPPEDIISINYYVEPIIWPFWRRNSALDHDPSASRGLTPPWIRNQAVSPRACR